VRHILERLVQRLGYDDIVAFVPKAEKPLVNIKTRRELAKRKEANAGMEMDIPLGFLDRTVVSRVTASHPKYAGCT
jgi:hypothetical protein